MIRVEPRSATASVAARNASGSIHCDQVCELVIGEPQVVEDTARLAGIAAGHIDRLDAKEAGAGDRTEDRDVETQARAAEASGIAERVELDGEWERCRAASATSVQQPPTCSSSFQATSASLFTNARKSQNVMTSVRRSVVAVTVAVRTDR